MYEEYRRKNVSLKYDYNFDEKLLYYINFNTFVSKRKYIFTFINN